ncbi:hypothetical protein ABIB57_004644 [Devosia sp. UYZn731]|uniref:hypothetical protein n=1 Tax=Devosia sp. UYZn731 TaxID=3156345 RepID=UPI003394DD3E
MNEVIKLGFGSIPRRAGLSNKLRTGLICFFATGSLGWAQTASGAPFSTDPPKAAGLWRFHLVEEDGGEMCEASVKLGAISTGITGFPGGTMFAFVDGPGLPDTLTMSWTVDGSQLSALTGEIDEYFGWHEFRDVNAALLGGLAEGSQLELRSGDASFGFSLMGAGTALDQFQKCMTDVSAPGKSVIAQTPGNQQSPVQLAPGGNDPSTALGRALQGSQQPMLATYVCDITATALTGLLDISGENKSTRMTLSVDSIGQLHVNGATIAPKYAEPQPNDGSPIALVAYSAQSVAATSSGVPAVMPGISEESMQGLQSAMNMMLGQAFEGRDRYMVISLDNDTVQFFDLSPEGQMVNTSASNCARVQ